MKERQAGAGRSAQVLLLLGQSDNGPESIVRFSLTAAGYPAQANKLAGRRKARKRRRASIEYRQEVDQVGWVCVSAVYQARRHNHAAPGRNRGKAAPSRCTTPACFKRGGGGHHTMKRVRRGRAATSRTPRRCRCQQHSLKQIQGLKYQLAGASSCHWCRWPPDQDQYVSQPQSMPATSADRTA